MKSTNVANSQVEIDYPIYVVRGQRIMLDRDLAIVYGVKAIALRQQVKRNQDRFPADFMFQLTEMEIKSLVSQNVIPSKGQLGGSSPYAFTQEGVAMLSGVLRSRQAVRANIAIMRAFVRLREVLANHKFLAQKLSELELKCTKHDGQIANIFTAIRKLLVTEEERPKHQIGFNPD